jgi:hypothetical protein
MSEAALMGIMEGIRQAHAHPAHRPHVGGLFEEAARRAFHGYAHRTSRLCLPQNIDNVSASPLTGRAVAQTFEKPCQCQAAQVRQAQAVHPLRREFVHGEERDDMCMLQLPQREVFLPDIGAQLQDNRPTGQRRLRCQEDVPLRATAEFRNETKIADRIADGGRSGQPTIGQQLLTGQQSANLFLPLGKTAL